MDTAVGYGDGSGCIRSVRLHATVGRGGTGDGTAVCGDTAAVHVPGAVRHVLQGGFPSAEAGGMARMGGRVPTAADWGADGTGSGVPHERRQPDSDGVGADVRHLALCHGCGCGDTETGRLAGADDDLYVYLELHHGTGRTRLLPDDREVG